MQTRFVQSRAGPLRLRPPRVEDADALHALVLSVAAEGRFFIAHADELRSGPQGLIESFRRIGSSDNGLCLVADGPAGLLGVVTISGGSLRRLRHVGRFELRVAAAARGQGVGRALAEEALLRAQAHSLLEKLSLAVFADNAPAIVLYRSLGFVEEGRRIGEYREDDGRLRDDLLMARSVRSGGSPG
jgi:RimJ/RimL family protein N-acetyltransferase